MSSSFPTSITNTTNTVTTASAAASSGQGHNYNSQHQHHQASTSTSGSINTSITSRLLGNSGAHTLGSGTGSAGGGSGTVGGYTPSGLHGGPGTSASASGSNIYSTYPTTAHLQHQQQQQHSSSSGNTSTLLMPPSASAQSTAAGSSNNATTTDEGTTSASATAAAAGNNGGASTSFYNHHYQQPSGHSFLSDVNEVKDMENSLLTLLASFHAGDLSAFGKGCSLQTMETIRAKQERLAKLHFELGTSKAGGGGNTGGGTGTTDSATQNWMSDDDQNKLVAELRELSLEIEKLHETSS